MHDIYYQTVTATRDSLYVSLLTASEELTVLVDVRMLGNVLETPGRFSVEVVPGKTDAVEGLHYRKLPDYYEFPAGEFSYGMPVTLLTGDEGITQKAVNLTLRIIPSSNLGVAYENRSEIRLVIANMMRMPTGTGYYNDLTYFLKLFGPYSVVKHRLIIEMTGHDFWDRTTSSNAIYAQAAYYTPYARKLYKLVTENIILDENNEQMQGWQVP